MKTNKSKIILFFISISCLMSVSTPSMSCDVPVFRYALERWQADIYELIVFYKEPLAASDKSNIELLEKSSVKHSCDSNYSLQTIDVKSGLTGEMLEILESLDSPELPCIAMRYPLSSNIRRVIWHGRLNKHNIQALIDSPVRQKISKKILGGDAAVFILLESGNKSKDDAVQDSLRIHLKEMEEVLKLPEQVLNYLSETERGNISEKGASFSFLRLSRSNSEESQFIDMLMNSEPDLYEYLSYPMVFPIYGRGRVFCALVGDGINEQNIYDVCAFINGPCSCEIKFMNPGVDLLMKVDWDAAINESWVAYTETQLLVGLPEHPSAEEDTAWESEFNNDRSESIVQQQADEGTGFSSSVLRNITVTLGIIALVIIVFSIIIGRRKQRDKR